MDRYSKADLSAALGISGHTIDRWVQRGLLPRIGQGTRAGYPRPFLALARQVRGLTDLWPRGPLENIRDHLYADPDFRRLWRAVTGGEPGQEDQP